MQLSQLPQTYFFQQSTQHDFILKQGNVPNQHSGIVGKLQKNVSV